MKGPGIGIGIGIKIFWAATFSFLVFGAFGKVRDAEAFRRNGERSTPVFVDQGDSPQYFSVNVGTTTAAQIFVKANFNYVRTVEVCNVVNNDLFIGTFTAVNATTSPRTYVPRRLCVDIPPTTDLYAIYESAAGASTNVCGAVKKDSNDN